MQRWGIEAGGWSERVKLLDPPLRLPIPGCLVRGGASLLHNHDLFVWTKYPALHHSLLPALRYTLITGCAFREGFRAA